jgi:hypothetical protein
MKEFSKSLGLSLVKAAITTILAIGVIAAMSSCTRVAGRNEKATNEWRGTVLKTGRHLVVKNIDSLSVMMGDTVTVFYSDGCGGQPAYYYIANTPDIACDTISTEMYVDGADTSYCHFEAWNVVLERRIVK